MLGINGCDNFLSLSAPSLSLASEQTLKDLKRSQNMGGSPGELNEELVPQEKRKKGWRMNCDVGEATEGLENEL